MLPFVNSVGFILLTFCVQLFFFNLKKQCSLGCQTTFPQKVRIGSGGDDSWGSKAGWQLAGVTGYRGGGKGCVGSSSPGNM